MGSVGSPASILPRYRHRVVRLMPSCRAAAARLPPWAATVCCTTSPMMLYSVREVSVLTTAAGCAAGALRRLRSLESRSATLLLRM